MVVGCMLVLYFFVFWAISLHVFPDDDAEMQELSPVIEQSTSSSSLATSTLSAFASSLPTADVPVDESIFPSPSVLWIIARSISILAASHRFRPYSISVGLLILSSFLASLPGWSAQAQGPLLVMALLAAGALTRLVLALRREQHEWLSRGAWAAADLVTVRPLVRTCWLALAGVVVVRVIALTYWWQTCVFSSSESEVMCNEWRTQWSFTPLSSSSSSSSWLSSILDWLSGHLLAFASAPYALLLLDTVMRLSFTIATASHSFLSLDGLKLIDLQRRLRAATSGLPNLLPADNGSNLSSTSLAGSNAVGVKAADSSKAVALPAFDTQKSFSTGASSSLMANAAAAAAVPTAAASADPSAMMRSLREVQSFVRDFLADAACQDSSDGSDSGSGSKSGKCNGSAANAKSESERLAEQLRQRLFLKSVTHNLRTPLQSGWFIFSSSFFDSRMPCPYLS